MLAAVSRLSMARAAERMPPEPVARGIVFTTPGLRARSTVLLAAHHAALDLERDTEPRELVEQPCREPQVLGERQRRAANMCA
jgi:hypothetical protein